MATPLPRTPADDATDALAKLDGIARELPNLRAWLERVRDDPSNAREAARTAHRIAEILEFSAASIRSGMWEVRSRPETLPALLPR